MSKKVVPVLGPVAKKNGPVVGVASELKEKKTRRPGSIESLLASVRALDGLVPSNEEDEIPGSPAMLRGSAGMW